MDDLNVVLVCERCGAEVDAKKDLYPVYIDGILTNVCYDCFKKLTEDDYMDNWG